MDEETRYLIEQIEKRFDALRDADREAVRLRHGEMSERLAGFPQQYATKVEAEKAAEALQRLEKDSLTREIYESNHKALADLVARLDKEKMQESVFKTFIDNYRIEQEAAATERRAVAAALAAATERRVGAEAGQAASWKQIGILLGLVTTVMTTVVVLANYLLR